MPADWTSPVELYTQAHSHHTPLNVQPKQSWKACVSHEERGDRNSATSTESGQCLQDVPRNKIPPS